MAIGSTTQPQWADIGFFLKRARVSELLLGDSAFHRNQFAELKGY